VGLNTTLGRAREKNHNLADKNKEMRRGDVTRYWGPSVKRNKLGGGELVENWEGWGRVLWAQGRPLQMGNLGVPKKQSFLVKMLNL